MFTTNNFENYDLKAPDPLHRLVFLMTLSCHLHGICICSYFIYMYSYFIRMSVVCTRMSSVCHSYVLVCQTYATRMYLYVICMSLVCTRMSSVCHWYVLICHPCVTRMWFCHDTFQTQLTTCSIIWSVWVFVLLQEKRPIKYCLREVNLVFHM